MSNIKLTIKDQEGSIGYFYYFPIKSIIGVEYDTVYGKLIVYTARWALKLTEGFIVDRERDGKAKKTTDKEGNLVDKYKSVPFLGDGDNHSFELRDKYMINEFMSQFAPESMKTLPDPNDPDKTFQEYEGIGVFTAHVQKAKEALAKKEAEEAEKKQKALDEMTPDQRLEYARQQGERERAGQAQESQGGKVVGMGSAPESL